MNRGTCSSCGARVLWVVTRAGERMPLDPDPFVDGEVLLERHGDETYALVSPVPAVNEDQLQLLDDVPRDPRPRYRSHWRTCPHADEHRVGAVLTPSQRELERADR